MSPEHETSKDPQGRLLVRRPEEEERDDIVRFIGISNGHPERRCLHLDASPEGVAGELADLDAPFEEVFHIATRRGRLVGAMGCECERSASRGWLLGPFVDEGEAYGTVARELLTAVEDALPSGLEKISNYLDERNAEGLAIHLAAGYHREGRSCVYHAKASSAHWQGEKYADLVAAGDEAAVAVIHEAAFPNTWMSATELLGDLGSKKQVFVARVDDGVAGYASAEMHPTLPEGSLGFLAVDPAFRGKGLGRLLLRTALRWVLEEKDLAGAQLVVEEGNVNARGLYEAVGFALDHVGICLARPVP